MNAEPKRPLNAPQMSDQPVTADELGTLSRWACVAFATRCALRVLPVLAARGNFDYWGKDSRRHFGAAERATLLSFESASTARSYRLAAATAYSDAYAIDADAASEAARGAGVGVGSAYATARYTYATTVDAYTAVRSAHDAYSAAVSAAADFHGHAEAIRASRADIDFLKKLMLPSRHPVPGEFFMQPLWTTEPAQWSEACADFHRALELIGRGDAWERFVRFGGGNELPTKEEIDSVFAAWEREFGGEAAPGAGATQESQPRTKPEDTPAATPGESSAVVQLALQLSGQADAPSEVDRLDFSPHVVAVAEFVRHRETRTPLTLSVEGRWGSGKSSFMRQVEAELKKAGSVPVPITTVRFNAWRHEKNEQLWAAFALAFFEQTAQAQPWWRRVRFWWAFKRASFDWGSGWLDAVQATLLGIRWVALAVIGGFAIKSGLQFGTVEEIIATAVGVTGLFFAVPKLLEQVTTLADNPLKTDLSRHFREEDYEAKVSFLHKFQDEFARFCRCYLEGGRRVVVFVDDLDRCDVPRAAELMQGLNLMIADEVPVVFVLGIDRAKVAAGLAVKHEKLLPYLYAGQSGTNQAARGIEYGYDFIEKFIQVPFRLPRPSEESLANLLVAGPTGAKIRESGGANKGGEQALAAEFVGDEMVPHPVRPSISGRKAGTQSVAIPDASSKRQSLVFAPRDDVSTMVPYVRHVADVLERNPRRILQFVNCFRLQAYVADQLGLLGEKGGAITLGQLVQLVAVGLRWPLLIADYDAELAQGRNLFEWILKAKNAPRDSGDLSRINGEVTVDGSKERHGGTDSDTVETVTAAKAADTVLQMKPEMARASRWATEAELVAFLEKPLPTVSGEIPDRSVAEVSTETLQVASASIAPEREVRR